MEVCKTDFNSYIHKSLRNYCVIRSITRVCLYCSDANGYIKTNYTKHISLKLFYPHEFQENGKISILQIKYCDNHANLFTKSLHLSIFDKCVKCKYITLHSFPFMSFMRISNEIFLLRQCADKYMSIS
jgi:hypothetical protein